MLVICPSGLPVDIQKLKVGQLNLLANREKLRSGETFESFLRVSALVDTANLGPAYPPGSFNWELALQGDRFFALTAIRRATYGEAFDFNSNCPVCKLKDGVTPTPVKWTVKLAELPVRPYAPECLQRHLKGEHEVTLVGGRRVTFRQLVGKDERPLAKLVKNKDDALTQGILYRLTSVEGVEKQGLTSWLDGLDAEEVLHLRALFEETSGGLETTLSITCEECEATFEVELPFGSTDFWIPKKSVKVTVK